MYNQPTPFTIDLIIRINYVNKKNSVVKTDNVSNFVLEKKFLIFASFKQKTAKYTNLLAMVLTT